MGMTDKEFTGYVRLILNALEKVLKKLPDGEGKEELRDLADILQKTVDD